MTNRKTTRRALLMSVVSLLVCVSMLVGTTFAWFTDSVTSANNIIKSGNLDVEMYWADGTLAVPSDDSTDWKDASTGAIFNYQLWEPGYTEVRHIKIENKGSLALKYKVSILANGEVSDLADVIDVYYVDPAVRVADRTELVDAYKLGTLTEVLANLDISGNGELIAGASDTITLAFKMQESAGNEYMGKAIGTDFSVILTATQLTYEEDSFDNQYDAGAANPTYSDPVPLPDSGPMTISDEDLDFSTTLPEELVDELRDTLGDANNKDYVPNLSLKLAGRNADTANKILSFTSVDLVDQDGNVIDLTNNDQHIEVKIYAGDSFSANDCVKVYHDGKQVGSAAIVDAEGYVTYTTLHFCEIEIVDSSTFLIHSADELIDALTALRTKAKTQIPGENGNKQYRVEANFILENDIVIDGDTKFMYTDSNGAPLHFYGVRGVLDLNGHSITVKSDALLNGKAHANAALLFQYSNMTIRGEGSIIAENKSIPVYAWANCTVDIYGGNYVTNASERNESAVYVNNASAKVNVYGGTYTDSKYAFNVHDNCGNSPVIVLHEGIVYANFLKNDTTDVTGSDITSGRIVLAENCVLSEFEENGVTMYKVVEE